ncbi:NAD(P)-dependent oxidoreductase [Aquisalimonas lutea]|uniref:SDR family oxidoreductase n=1 Tax=Aquisalimonas lutea TaxID=1327750 RepID=UPI0025B5304E|nr:NAD(P)-dependent oxidoreductase [Aquisalimonas lutea]MDN3518662.1 NAD(P)-dependent oxidoreductase [Aquisalimonas lutea]
MTTLKNKTLFITGASRGVGLAIGKRAAQDGANVVIAAKTDQPHPKLPGTIYTAAEEIEQAGGRALPVVTDVRSEEDVIAAVNRAVETFGGIDILVNNASAINLAGTEDLDMKRYDLMHQINLRGTFLCSRTCIPHLRKADNPHVLNLSPPLNMDPKWFAPHVAYTMAKYGMSMCAMGMAEEYRNEGIAFNALWPRTLLDTAAVRNLLGGEAAARQGRKPEIMADAAYHVLTRNSRECTGNFFIDDALLAEAGVTDFSPYRVDPDRSDDELQQDLFL